MVMAKIKKKKRYWKIITYVQICKLVRLKRNNNKNKNNVKLKKKINTQSAKNK